jgi:SAM-dependent methyltransferase
MSQTLERATQVQPETTRVQAGTTLASVDITIPVLNEERAIGSSLATLASYLDSECVYDWAITVADNGSNDRTFEVASAFAAGNPRIRIIRLDQRGRGRALKQAWSTSMADVVAYMDVDLSAGLDSLQALIDPIVEGRCEISIGSRLAPGAQIARCLQREVISRTYNKIARRFLHYDIVDAQCGFKAVRTSVVRELISKIEDNAWFFDTELLALAHRSGMRISEIPVRWVDDDDSRVRIAKTAAEDLKGIWRLWLDERRSAGAPASRPVVRGNVPLPSVATNECWDFDFDELARDCEDNPGPFLGSGSTPLSSTTSRRKVEILEEIIRPELGSLQGLSLLDVRCGTGATDRYLAPRVRALHGVAMSGQTLLGPKHNINDAMFASDVEKKLPYEDGEFDVVVATCALRHVPISMRSEVVREMVRVTRPGGIVVVFEHNPRNLLTRFTVNTCDAEQDSPPFPVEEAVGFLKDSTKKEPGFRYFSFSPLRGAIGCSLDRHLRSVRFGGQYVVWAQRS